MCLDLCLLSYVFFCFGWLVGEKCQPFYVTTDANEILSLVKHWRIALEVPQTVWFKSSAGIAEPTATSAPPEMVSVPREVAPTCKLENVFNLFVVVGRGSGWLWGMWID